jgi:hypothetical protein
MLNLKKKKQSLYDMKHWKLVGNIPLCRSWFRQIFIKIGVRSSTLLPFTLLSVFLKSQNTQACKEFSFIIRIFLFLPVFYMIFFVEILSGLLMNGYLWILRCLTSRGVLDVKSRRAYQENINPCPAVVHI